MKIVILDASTLGEVASLSKLNSFGNVVKYDATKRSETVERVKDAEIVLTNKVVFDKEIIDQLPSLKLICITATGMNNVDLKYAEQKGISVKNAVGYSTHSVSQVTFSMVLQLMSNLNNYDKYVKNGEYAISPIFTFLDGGFEEINGKKWGIIGLGNIGRNVAKIATAFGANVSYFSASGTIREEKYPSVSLDKLLQESDIISIHSPLNSNTENLINIDAFDKMKSNSILINVARGGIVNEKDLVEALNNNKILGAGVDVFVKEPIEKTSPYYEIIDKNKVVFSPHIAWASEQARHILIEKVIENIKNYLDK